MWELKRTVSRDISPSGFFVKLILLILTDKPRKSFNFFQIFVDLYDYFGADLCQYTDEVKVFV
jgi:hypothetical protein